MEATKSKCTFISNNKEENAKFRKNYEKLIFQQLETETNTPISYSNHGERLPASFTKSVPPPSCHSSIVYTSIKETQIRNKPNIEFVEKIKEVPSYVYQSKNRVIEIPEVTFVDKIQYDPVVVEKLKYVPKEVTKYNIIEKPVIKNIVTEKKVDVLHVQEKISFKDQEIVEEVYHYVDKDNNTYVKDHGSSTKIKRSLVEGDMHRKFDYPAYQPARSSNTNGANVPNVGNYGSNICNNHDNAMYEMHANDVCEMHDSDVYDMQDNAVYDRHDNAVYNMYDNDVFDNQCSRALPPLLEPFGPQVNVEDNKTFENVFVPKVEKVVEVKKKIDIPINLPVPYIVPKPKIIDVDVPVFKFNDKYIPVPVRQKIIPKVTWSDKVYQVDCVIEKPYLVYHDIIKFVPCDSKIMVREYPRGITKINQDELYEVDNLALWMRVNADLKEEKDKLKKKNDNLSDHTCECSDCDSYEEVSNTELNSSQDVSTIKSSNENLSNTMPIHPGHPLEIIHLQNKWIKQDTTKTSELYSEQFLEAHKNAIFNLSTRLPREAEIDIKQIFAKPKEDR
ncbi:inner membrane complex protein 1b, putative (IMC1b) [Plasmodium ovale curtisi]|uniref:Inner membrane complex protein 1b, putative (IMC1b) n=1 Tax=Plasmodium ovale curtisi TaxID=864141 RepID=A0A1A8VXB5_PLAOA|nr:inner membrane complex protein 1b, putative (IMC1b) [Plasmodium ovale curtisi]SBS92053.1 inner membrane complex protein 1b, putative (IMC1b) [Plasmodium ovale curtisi]